MKHFNFLTSSGTPSWGSTQLKTTLRVGKDSLLTSLKYILLIFAVLLGVGNAWGEVWKKVTSAPSNWSGEYLIVYENSTTAYVWTGKDETSCYATATISNGTISKPDGAQSVTIASMSGGYSLKVNGGTNSGKYMKNVSNNGISFSTTATANTLTYENSAVTITCGGKKFRYNNQSGNYRFRYFGSDQQKIQLYKKAYTVTYNANTGSGTMTDSNSPYFAGSNVTVKSNTFTAPANHAFDHWNTAANNSGNNYAAGATISSISQDVTLYAQWVSTVTCSNEITITKGTPSHGSFDITGDGDVCIDNGNASVTISNIQPTNGYRFKQITSSGGGTIDNSAKTVTNISANTTINVVFEQIPSHKAYFYNGSTLLNIGGTSFQEGASVSYGGSSPVSCDTGEGASNTFVGWATAEWDDKVAKNVIVPDFYESTLPVMGDEDVTYYAVFAKVSSAGELFSWEGGGKETLTGLDEVTGEGLGSDYAAGNSPYLVKLDNTGDYIVIATSAAIGSVAVGVKMIGGASTSTLTIQESTATDGTFTDVQALSISGSQNDVLNLSTSNAFKSGSRAVKLLFTKGSNVGVGPITITGVASASNYMTTCCEPLAQINGSVNLSHF